MMVGKVLRDGQGICNDLFKDGGDEDGEAAAEDAPDDDDIERAADKVDKADILNTQKHKFVKEVVNDKKIHYWDVPRLGSFMAIPLIYRSCLSEVSLDKALIDYIEILK